MKIISVFVLLAAVTASSAAAMDFQEMLAGAVENDARLQGLSGVLANTLLNIEKAKLAPGFQMQLSTGQVRIGYSFDAANADEPPWVIYAEPSGALILGRRAETEMSVQVPFVMEFGAGDSPAYALAPKFSIRQPIDKLFGAEKLTTVQNRENLLAAEKARIDVLNRVTEMERSVVSQLSVLADLEHSGRQIERDLDKAQNELEQARELQIYTEGSAQLRQLEFSVVKLQREAELTELQHKRAWRKLERIVGISVDALPENLPVPELKLPAPGEEELNPVVHLARLNLNLEEARLKDEREPAKPKFYLAGVLNNSRDELGDERKTAVSGVVEGVFDDVSVSAGIGGILETGHVFVSGGLSWSLKDRKIEAMNLQERENELDISRWDLAAARDDYQTTYELLALEVEEFGFRHRNLEEDRALAELRLNDSTQWLEQGLITQEELDDARWERASIDYAERILWLDALLLKSRLDAFTPLDGDNQ